MAKPFLSFENQLNMLEKEKGLVINDRAYAEKKLREIGYFGLIGGYKSPFKNPTTKKYRDGVAFEDIVALYKFDENLRELFLKYILQFERHIRSLLSYYFTEKFGERQICYLDPANYTSDFKRQADKRSGSKHIVPPTIETDSPVTSTAEDMPSKSRILFAVDGLEKLRSIEQTINRYGNYAPWQLVSITHREGSPWSYVDSSREYQAIPDRLILKHHHVETEGI